MGIGGDMKALTKGQYEGIANTLNYALVRGWIGLENIGAVAERFADQFQESDPQFKRELFLKQCGVDNE
jgi:hypothetical protein